MVLCSLISVIKLWPLSPDQLFVTQELINKTGSLERALLVYLLLVGLYGAVCMAGTSFYDIESWSMLKAAIVHYSTMVVAYVPMALYLGWISPSLQAIAMTLLVLAGIYAAIWLVLYLRCRRTTQQLNELLEKTKARD